MPTDLATILKLQVALIVRIGVQRLPVDDVLSLGPGAIMEIDKDADEELELLIGNKRIGTGAAVKVGENFGIRVNEIAPTSDRVEALGG